MVKSFILLGDIHKSIYFLIWKEQGSQLNLLAKDFGNLDCFATEFLIDGSSLRLVVADEQKNIQIFFYAPKMSESWKGQSFSQGLNFMLVPMLQSSCGCRCSLTQGPIQAPTKLINMLCYLVPWMAALVVLRLLMNSNFVGCSHYKKSLLMQLPMLLV